MITAKQCKAARSLLGWTLDDLVEKSGVSRTLLFRFENERDSFRSSKIEQIQRAFANTNVEFIGDYGIAEKRDKVEILKGSDCLERLWQIILNSVSGENPEILITNVDEKRTLDSGQGDLIGHIQKLKEKNITERLLSCEGDYCFVMPRECYRWLPKDVFAMGTSTYIFADKVAHQLWGNEMIMLAHSKDAYEAERRRFEYMWENAQIPPEK